MTGGRFAWVIVWLLLATSCGQELAVGSDVLWSARFEAADFSEWIGVAGGSADAFPPPNSFEISGERIHQGRYAAKLTIVAGSDGKQANVGLSRSGGLPVEGYYSAWYYLPRTITVGTFWVIFKFRMRAIADDPSTTAELYDLNLLSLPSGEMSLRLYDHRSGDVALDAGLPVVPVDTWFQIEAFYRNASDDSGRLTIWLDGRPITDIAHMPMAPSPWVAWDVVSVGVDLDPSTAVIYVDDCGLSRRRVGPTGVLSR